MARFILASQSPRRKSLLEWAEIKFEIVISNTDESYPSTLPISEVPTFIAKHKAIAVEQTLKAQGAYDKETCIIAADTVVVLNDLIIGKPADRADAISSIKKLQGKTHQVITGVSLLYNGVMENFSEVTNVSFHPLTEDQIIYYVDNYKPYDKAGAYAIQEWIGVIGIEKIDGDFYNVMGLPVSKLIQKIKQLGLMD
jgi:septum formation protein